MKKFAALLLAAIAGAALTLPVWRWWSGPEGPAPEPAPAPVTLPAESDGEWGDTPDAGEDAPWSEGFGSEAPSAPTAARRLAPVPGAPAPGASGASLPDPLDLTPENIDGHVRSALAQALEGDFPAAYFLNRAWSMCRGFPEDEAGLERRVDQWNRRARRMSARGIDLERWAGLGGPRAISEDPEENRRHLEGWFDACGRVRETMTLDLRADLERRGRAGDPMARYLYALWPEENLTAEEAFERQFRWEQTARDFSLANLEQGEVAGLMAFGQSYLQGLFTARNPTLALAFALAAVQCGFEDVSSRSFLSERIDRLTASEDPADQERLRFVITMADSWTPLCKPMVIDPLDP